MLKYELIDELKPDYSYVDDFLRVSKQGCKKSNLKKIGGVGGTEHEMALSIDLFRIWDCGKKRWSIGLNR